ncbi:MAG: porin [Nitrospirota bacterium]
MLPRIGALLLGWFLGTVPPSAAWAGEPTFTYYDDLPPIEQTELEAVQERVQEARKRLKIIKGEPAKPKRKPVEPLPEPGPDERDTAGAVDFEEVDELRQAFKQLSKQQPKEEEPPSPSKQAPAPPQGSEAATEKEIKALSERVAALEKVMVGTEEQPGLAGLIGGYTRRNGFFLMSSEGDFFLRIPALLQADLRTFPSGQNGANPGVSPSTFILQRVRPMIHFRLWRYFRGLMTPDFGNGFTQSPLVQGRVQTPDAFGEWDYFPAFRVRVGKFKSPIGLEMLQAPQNLSFMERSLTRNLLPNRDLGAMVWGAFQHGLLEYQLGVFNGSPNANFYQESAATSSAKTLEARVFSRPFVGGDHWLRGLGLGVGMSVGSVKQASGQDQMQTETFSYTFFQYQSTSAVNVQGNGTRLRFAPQIAWYGGRVGVMGQYVRSTQEMINVANQQTATLTHDAWSGQVSVLLTDDTATFGRIEPRHPVDPSKGQWGAWELAVRYAQLNIDPATYTYNFADPGVSVLRAKSTTVGLNWYLNANVRITANFVHTDFTGASRAYHAASHEDGLLFRTQLVF